jgi:hypothetical protein
MLLITDPDKGNVSLLYPICVILLLNQLIFGYFTITIYFRFPKTLLGFQFSAENNPKRFLSYQDPILNFNPELQFLSNYSYCFNRLFLC